MKKLSIICALVMVFGVMSAPAFAVNDYDVDYLESGNPGYPANLGVQTWDSATGILVTEGDTFDVDVYLRNAAGTATNGGFAILYDATLLTITAASTYAPPWSGGSSPITIPGGTAISTFNLSGAAPDAAGDIICTKLTFDCIKEGVANVTVQANPFANTWAPDPPYLADDSTINPVSFDMCNAPSVACVVDGDCDDADVCNGLETCGAAVNPGWCGYSGTVCIPGTALDCDDQIDCTDDTCDAITGCDNAENNANCDDSRSCTVDTCDGTVAAPATGCTNDDSDDSPCDDSNPCTDDVCSVSGPVGTGCVITNNTDPCDDGDFCTLTDECDGGACVGTGETCDDSNPCTDDVCTGTACENTCNATSPTEPCCDDPACASAEVCAAGGVINIGDFYANCGDVGVKIDLCLENLATPVGGFQMDLCENPHYVCAGTNDVCVTDSDCTGDNEGRPCIIDGADPDCLTCVECEMTERTVLFDCVVNELANGCCRVILFSKNPGGLINPGECDIVTIVYTISDDPECCDECIPIDGMGIILTDEYGYDILGVIGELGEVCPYECGDIEPGCAQLVCSNQTTDIPCTEDADCPAGWPASTCSECATGTTCGDGDVDIFDILLEVDFALGTKVPDACQKGTRSNVPTGTPPNCIAPNENCSVTQQTCDLCLGFLIPPPIGPDVCVNDLPFQIDILDIMVIIDMALDRQDCCSYYYAGIIW